MIGPRREPRAPAPIGSGARHRDRARPRRCPIAPAAGRGRVVRPGSRCGRGTRHRSAVHSVSWPPRSRNATPAAELGVPRVPGQQRSCLGVARGDDGRCRCSTRGPERPLGVGRHGQAPRSAGAILDAQDGDLHRVVERHELHQVELDAVTVVLEAAVAGSVPDDVRRVLPSDRAAPSGPTLAAVIVPQVDALAHRIADRVVRPRRQLVLAAVLRPGVSRPGLGDLEAE